MADPRGELKGAELQQTHEVQELSKREMEAAQGGARAKEDQIDLSVCDLATFDHKKCLG